MWRKIIPHRERRGSQGKFRLCFRSFSEGRDPGARTKPRLRIQFFWGEHKAWRARGNIVRKKIVLFILVVAMPGWATEYYVSSSDGNDANNGTSAATPWQTFGGVGDHITGGTFSAGDVIYLKRGDTWNEQLIPPSAGTLGNPIQFDAYGAGPAPMITAATPGPFVSSSWSLFSGNVWRATLVTTISSPTVSQVQFGALYGMKRTGSCGSTVANKYEWCVSWPYLYVYSPAGTNPVVT